MIKNKIIGNLKKMQAELDNPVRYYLHLNEETIFLNDFLGKKIHFHYTGKINCIHCGRHTNKSFQQGYCFPCLRKLQECDLCIIHPERCHVEKGGCPEDDWAHKQCYSAHVVYLANSSGLKVGITRHTHVPTRWIDQGAQQALPILSASNRYRSGVVEVILKKYVSDRTNWRTMLKQDVEHIDLIAAREQLLAQADDELNVAISQFEKNGIALLDETHVVELRYPVLSYPEKVSSLSFDKTATIKGNLLGIKGQYLILDKGVLNIRKFGGYQVEFGYE